MRDLTARQARVLDWINNFVRKHNMPPTVREIGGHFKITSAGAFGHLKALEKKGYLKRGKLGARSLDLAAPPPRPDAEATRIPVLGHIAAGQPLFADENMEGHLTIDRSLLRSASGSFFALRVRGNSMIEDGILDGDIAIVRQQDSANNGDTVVALIEDEATLKRFYRERQRIRLQPANATMKPIYTKQVRIQGVMTGLVRGAVLR